MTCFTESSVTEACGEDDDFFNFIKTFPKLEYRFNVPAVVVGGG